MPRLSRCTTAPMKSSNKTHAFRCTQHVYAQYMKIHTLHGGATPSPELPTHPPRASSPKCAGRARKDSAKAAPQLRPTHTGTTPGLIKTYKRLKAPLASRPAPTRLPHVPCPSQARRADLHCDDDADPRLESKVAYRSVVRAPRPPRWLCRVVVFCDRGCVIGIGAGGREKWCV